MKNSFKTLLNRKIIFSVMFLLTITSGILKAQGDIAVSDTTRKDAIRLFLDCQSCDMNYIRQEMPYINYVRDIREAQIYALVTRQATGSGGGNYTIFYSGQESFAGMKDTLTYSSDPDATTDVTRTGLTNTLALGLMRYVAKTPIKNSIQVSFQSERQEDPAQVADKWNYWVFELKTSPDIKLEKSQQKYSWSNGISVDRITADWKLQNSFNQRYDKSIFIRERVNNETGLITESKTIAIKKSWNFANLTVKSISNHLSVGLRASAISSSFRNIDLQIKAAPAIEYNLFPYSVSNQKQLRVLYGIGFVHNEYVDTTVYNKIEEDLLEQTFDVAFRVQQKWGSANMAFGYAAYLNDLKKNNISLDANLRIRILKGLSFELSGGMKFIHNQIELARGDRSAEDVYLRLAELETNYRFSASVGLTYTFGSIYNNIVNPRFGGGASNDDDGQN